MGIKDIRINEQIDAPQVMVVADDGGQKAVLNTMDAIRLAREKGLDLIEVSANANPPVCKILDFGKYLYELERHQKQARKNQTLVKLKEVRMQVKVDVGDLNTKVRFITEFLQEGNKVKVSVRFRGREMQHPEIGEKVLGKVLMLLEENCVGYTLEQSPNIEGRMMGMLLAPPKKRK